MQLSDDIVELREDGGLPEHLRTCLIVLPRHQVLEIRVDGHNIITLDCTSPPLFTQRIVLVDPFGQPFAAKVGASMGEPEPFTPRL